MFKKKEIWVSRCSIAVQDLVRSVFQSNFWLVGDSRKVVQLKLIEKLERKLHYFSSFSSKNTFRTGLVSKIWGQRCHWRGNRILAEAPISNSWSSYLTIGNIICRPWWHKKGKMNSEKSKNTKVKIKFLPRTNFKFLIPPHRWKHNLLKKIFNHQPRISTF